MPPKDLVTSYCTELIRMLEQSPCGLAERLKRRFAGQEGPGLRDARSWAEVLIHAYRATPDTLRQRWVDATWAILQHFDGDKLVRLSTNDDGISWLHLTGALELAQSLDWPENNAADLRALLGPWLQVAGERRFPGPRNLYQEKGILGQGEIDLLSMVLRLAIRYLPWQRVSNRLWDAAVQAAGLSAEVRATRCWELARWAIAHKEYNWLAKHLGAFHRSLEGSDWYPGNLTQLFFVTEIEHGRDRVKELIGELAGGQYLPVDEQVRKEFAHKLDYYGTSEPMIRAQVDELASKPVQGVPPVQAVPKESEPPFRQFLLGLLDPSGPVGIRPHPG